MMPAGYVRFPRSSFPKPTVRYRPFLSMTNRIAPKSHDRYHCLPVQGRTSWLHPPSNWGLRDDQVYRTLPSGTCDRRQPLSRSFIGTAGWSIPKQHAGAFPREDSHLERYARRLPAVEINSSFYRLHRPATYGRWAASVPPGFRFSAKVPREVTHTRRLVDVAEPLERFLGEVKALGAALGPLLVQLPPSLRYDQAVAKRFFGDFRERFGGQLACEPRHETWFSDAAEAQLENYRVTRVVADPAVVPQAALPGGWQGFLYIRLHGSPKIYHSAYSPETIGTTAQRLRDAPEQVEDRWCIFDNTALGEATGQALDLLQRLRT